MFWIDLLFALAIVLLIATAFSLVGRQSGMGRDLLLFVLLLFLGTWALGRWFRPVGPAAWGVFWVPYLIAGLLVALLLIAALAVPGPRRRVPRTAQEAREELQTEAAVTATFGISFWLFLIVALTAIAASYFF